MNNAFTFTRTRRKDIITAAVTWSLALVATLVCVSSASAGTYPMYECSSSAPSVAAGWSTISANTLASTSLSDGCATGGALGDHVFSNEQEGAVIENGHSGSLVGLNLAVPGSVPDVSVKSISAKAIGSSVTGDDAFMQFGSEGHALPGAVELPYGTGVDYVSNENWTLPQGARDFQATVSCTTDHSSTTCYFAHAASVPALTEMTLILEEGVPPVISNVSGTLASSAKSNATVSGSHTLTFTSTDADSGVRSASLTITPQAGGTADAHTFDFSSQCAYTSWNACPTKQSINGYSFDTSTLKDGVYRIEIEAKDAAGNIAYELLGTLTTHNAPTNKALPAILTPSQVSVGVALTGQTGEWSAPAGAGNITYTYQWEDCDTQGNNCQIIPGAQSADYTPAPSDVNHTLRLTIKAANNDGTATATSSATTTVISTQGSLGAGAGPGTGTSGALGGLANPNVGPAGNTSTVTPTGPAAPSSNSPSGVANGVLPSENAELRLGGPAVISRAFAHSALTLTGRLLSAGHPIQAAILDVLEEPLGASKPRIIKHVITTYNGTFTMSVPAGPSRLLEVAYRAYTNDANYTSVAKVTESSAASVRLSITPTRESSTGTIKLRGTVRGPIPTRGTIIEPLVKYRGHWVPIIGKARTDKHGRFSFAYKFQGAKGRFPFEVYVPSGQAGFPYTAAYSQTVNVTTH